MCARSVIRSSSALHSRGFGNTVGVTTTITANGAGVMDLQDVHYEVERGLAWITIDRPERLHA